MIPTVAITTNTGTASLYSLSDVNVSINRQIFSHRSARHLLSFITFSFDSQLLKPLSVFPITPIIVFSLLNYNYNDILIIFDLLEFPSILHLLNCNRHCDQINIVCFT